LEYLIFALMLCVIGFVGVTAILHRLFHAIISPEVVMIERAFEIIHRFYK